MREVKRTMIRKISALSPVVALRRVNPPVDARAHAILTPQHRQRPARSIMLLASVGAAVAAVALASMQVSAGQTTLNLPSAHAIASPQGANARNLRLASDGQSNAEKSAAKSQKSHSADEAAMLRKKLDALEQILVQNQQENARLRQQVRALEAQRGQKIKALGAQQSQRTKALEAQENARAAMSKRATAAAADQFAATKVILRDLQHQQELLKTQAQQADALYRNGMTTYQNAISKRAGADINRARIDAAESQLKELQAGHQSSVKEEFVARLREQLAEQKAKLAQEQEGLRIAQERFKAGITSNSELVEAELKVSRTQTEIDKLNAQIIQATAR
jgi:hypothetical protein